jgi:hypothetical protein
MYPNIGNDSQKLVQLNRCNCKSCHEEVLSKNGIIVKVKAMADFKIDSETETEVTLREGEKDVAKLKQNEGSLLIKFLLKRNGM